MSLDNTSLNPRGYTTAELIRINDFVVREDAVARDDQSVRALEEALAQLHRRELELNAVSMIFGGPGLPSPEPAADPYPLPKRSSA